MKYKNISKGQVKFRAASSAKDPSVKKVYIVEAGKEIELPVIIDHPYMELVETKSKKGGD